MIHQYQLLLKYLPQNHKGIWRGKNMRGRGNLSFMWDDQLIKNYSYQQRNTINVHLYSICEKYAIGLPIACPAANETHQQHIYRSKLLLNKQHCIWTSLHLRPGHSGKSKPCSAYKLKTASNWYTGLAYHPFSLPTINQFTRAIRNL